MREQPDTLSPLLAAAQRARQRGDTASARTLLRAITTQYASAQAWLMLASVAETLEEQRNALRYAVQLDPDNQVAKRSLAVLQAAVAERKAAAAPAPAPRPIASAQAQGIPAVALRSPLPAPATPAPRQHWLTVALLSVALALAGVLLVVQPWREGLPAAPGGLASAATPRPSAAPGPSAAPAPTAPAATLTPLPPTATPMIFGTFQRHGAWSVSLLRPSDAMVLSGSIGAMQPSGRFVLALVAVGNGTNQGGVLPADLLTLSDGSGRRYRPNPVASTAYLRAYGAGQAGVFSMEQTIPGNQQLVSVPVIFDVPTDVHQLMLAVGDGSQGWSIRS